jgi:hypothetical protein
MQKGNEKLSQELAGDLEKIKALVNRCILLLSDQSKAAPKPLSATPSPRVRNDQLDFDSHIRAFAKKHARGFGGPQKFVLLLAYICKGRVGETVALNEIEQQWNRMTSPSLLGGKFNRFYTNSAKEHGWVNSPKKGLYVLRPTWTEIFKED